MGLVSYYRKFIKNCSTIAAPMIELTKKKSDFNWTTECDVSFNALRNALTSDSVLTIPDYTQPFKVEEDASKRQRNFATTWKRLETNSLLQQTLVRG